MNTQYKITLIVMWMITLCQASVTLYLPAFPTISTALHITPVMVKNTIAIFFIGYGLSQIIYGPLSDRYGRKIILLIGICIFLLGCLMSILCTTEAIFVLSRLLQGIGCGSMLTNGRAILRDCFYGRELAAATSYTSMGFAIGFGASPVLGAYLLQYFGWKTDFIFLFFSGLLLIGIIWKWLPETSSQKNRNNFLSLGYNTLSEYVFILHQPLFLRCLLAGLFAYTAVVAYNVMTPFLVQEVLGFSANTYGWLAVLVAIPYYTAASINRRLVLKFGVAPIVESGSWLVVLAGVGMAVTMLSTTTYLAFIIVPMMIATFGQALIFANSIAVALNNVETHSAGKASALISGLQIFLTGIFSAMMALLPDTTQLPLASVIILSGFLSGGILWKKLASSKHG